MSNEFVTQVVTGGTSPSVNIQDTIGKAVHRLDEIATEMAAARDEDTARWQALNEERKAQAETLSALKAQYETTYRQEQTDAAIRQAAEIKAELAAMRAPSKAATLSGGRNRSAYEQGAFLDAVMGLRSRDPEVYSASKAKLQSLGGWADATGKATLGTSDATGGGIIPNAIVDELLTPAMAESPYRRLMTVVPGVTTAAIDLPFRSARRAAATVVPFGDVKTNADLAYNGYTATLYTLAKIHDISAQFARQSRGAAERDVMNELAAAFAQGEADYIREGTGSSQPYGFMTALANSPATFTTSFTASATTLAGSIARSIADAAGALAARGVTPNGALMSASSFWTMASQGTDTAGFFFNTVNGAGGIAPGTLMTAWGLPVYPDATADIKGTASVTDNLVVADWSKFKIFTGQSYRVDTSEIAGERWDRNLIGFRAEMELAFDGRPAVYAGNAQLIADIVP